ncbi:MAG: 23S rRNA (uracil(1939)-C(5))-methyltransferase RlmD, partial [Porphyromonadaceae bacterium]|nr:23S rRNA (uracil(1939)-C(5))-methyltransferase RlmD [Porphyromonadaceae bacterium]
MARNKKPLPLFEKVTITDVAAEGKAIAKINDLVVFIPYVAPGDIVDVQITRKKNSYAEGKAVYFHSLSDKRAVPFCQHFGICGGCKWQHLPYEEQLKYKHKQVIDNLTRIGKVNLEEVLPILGSEKTTYYRNKLEFTFSNKKWLTEEEIGSDKSFDCMNAVGFHIPGMFDKVLDIKDCWLQSDLSNQIRLSIREYCLTHDGFPFFDLRNQEGLMRTLIVRTASTGELMVIVVFFKDEEDKREALLSHIASQFPQITSLLYIINTKCNDTITDQEVNVYKGKDHIIEEMEGLKFKVGPKSFYQTNSDQAYNLYKITRSFAGLTGNEMVYDLYTGTGTIANFVSGKAKKVIGIEYVPEAIEDAARLAVDAHARALEVDHRLLEEPEKPVRRDDEHARNEGRRCSQFPPPVQFPSSPGLPQDIETSGDDERGDDKSQHGVSLSHATGVPVNADHSLRCARLGKTADGACRSSAHCGRNLSLRAEKQASGIGAGGFGSSQRRAPGSSRSSIAT